MSSKFSVMPGQTLSGALSSCYGGFLTTFLLFLFCPQGTMLHSTNVVKKISLRHILGSLTTFRHAGTKTPISRHNLKSRNTVSNYDKTLIYAHKTLIYAHKTLIYAHKTMKYVKYTHTFKHHRHPPPPPPNDHFWSWRDKNSDNPSSA